MQELKIRQGEELQSIHELASARRQLKALQESAHGVKQNLAALQVCAVCCTVGASAWLITPSDFAAAPNVLDFVSYSPRILRSLCGCLFPSLS